MLRSVTKTFGILRSANVRLFSSTSTPIVSTSEAASLVDQHDVRFLDIRDPRQFEAAHVPGAANCIEFFTYLAMSNPRGVAHMERTFEQLLRSKGVTGDERIICYEDSLRTMYGASCRAWYVLKTLGHPDVQVLDGGWQKWQREALPVSTGPEAKHEPGNFTVKFDTAKWVGFKDMLELQGDETGSAVKLLDVRDQVEWDARSSSPYGIDFAPRMGRLHGAIHVEWYDFMEDTMDDEVSFKPASEIRDMMASKGFDLNDRIVLYCFKGARASNTLMALTLAGFENVQMYFASWNEWSRIKDAPYDGQKLGIEPESKVKIHQ